MQDRTDTGVDDQPPRSPADALAIIEREQARQVPPYWIFYLIWGAAWAVIGLAWFANGTGAVTAATAGVLTGLAIAGGSIGSGLVGSRMGRGVTGPSQLHGALYGWVWPVAMIGVVALAVGLGRLGAPVGFAMPALFVFVTGGLFAVGAAVRRDIPDYALGLGLLVLGAALPFVPAPWHALALAVVGGGALVATGLWTRARAVR
ncbi:hypothetical protein WHI96_01775 [Pseudonocardia tropica]|uniref:Uncharacterized protein n=1 Tax=Pseudonocardia tropica TaxID=681289 RepID=A0ABV1JNL7_9PSEU